MFLLLDKPKDITSFKFIKQFARENNIKKIGHTGTLDPLASGLLLIAADDDTKLINYIDKGPKTYVAQARLFQKSDTYDITGQIIDLDKRDISKEELKQVINFFKGKQKQMPPAFSAKKINGKRAYELARNNQEVILKEIDIEISNIELLNYKDNEFEFKCTVSRGTYIRTLIHDIGLKLATGSLMLELRRTMVAGLLEKDINQEINEETLITCPKQEVTLIEINLLIQGKTVLNNYQITGQHIIMYQNKAMGICDFDANQIKSIKLFGNKIDKILK